MKESEEKPEVQACRALSRGEHVIIAGHSANKVALEISLICRDVMVFGRNLKSVMHKSKGLEKAVLCILDADLQFMKDYHCKKRTIFCCADEPDERLNEYFTIIKV